MLSIFPADWQAPRPKHWFGSKKPVQSLAAPAVPSKPVQVDKPKQISAHFDLEKARMFMPPEELCLGEELTDTTEIDMMLEEIWNPYPSPEFKYKQMLQTINVIKHNLQTNILRLKNSPTYEADNISKEDVLKLL